MMDVLLNVKSTDFTVRDIIRYYLHNQRADPRSSSFTPDLLLACNDGAIPVHACVLTAASPFFKKILEESTGQDSWIGARKVLMPEFSVHILKKVIQLIYDDYVLLDSESEAKSVQETMKILEIFPGAGGPVVAKTVLKDQLQVKCFLPSEKVPEIGRNNESKGLPRTDFQKNESKNENKVGKNLSQVSPAPSSHHQLPSARQQSSVTQKLVPVVPKTVPVAQNSMPIKPISIPQKSPMLPISIKLPPQSTTQNAKSPEPKNSAFPRESAAIALVRPETVPMETEEAIKKPKIQDHLPRNAQKNAMPTSEPYQLSAPVPVTASSGSEIVPVITKPVEDLNRIPTKTENPARDVRRAAHPVSNPSSFIPVAPKNAQNSEFPPATEPRMPRNVVPTPSEDTDPGTDAEMDYNDLDRFLQRARSCQKCKSVYTSAGTATSCLASHNGRVRCYFCFRVCRSKIQLFDHYKRVHQKPGDLANTVVCPYCGQVIPFLAVSCHVVAVHILSDQSSKKTIVKSEPVIVKQKPPPPPPPVISPTPQQEQSAIDPGIMKTEIRNDNVCDIKDNIDYSVRTVTNNGKEYVVVLHKPKAHPL